MNKLVKKLFDHADKNEITQYEISKKSGLSEATIRIRDDPVGSRACQGGGDSGHPGGRGLSTQDKSVCLQNIAGALNCCPFTR